MKILDLTYTTPQENLACDEALLRFGEDKDEILRFWEPNRYFVVLGYSRRSNFDVRLEFCKENNIPIYRRITGGGTVLQGEGCLNFSLILSSGGPHELTSIAKTNEYVLKHHKKALERITKQKIGIQGISDLTIGDMKFSGNSQRREKNLLLFQGTFLLSFDIPMIEKTLTIPDRQPRYRQNRPHKNFLMNLKIDSAKVKKAIAKEWNAISPLKKIPDAEIAELAETKYSDDNWNRKF